MLDRLAHGPPILLDGGLATQLEAQGHKLDSNLWSARLLRDDPQAILAAHRAFVDAGAECVITATYQARAEPADLLLLAVKLARESGARFVAASIGPYGAVMGSDAADSGAEYTGDYPDVDLEAWHAPRFETLASSSADILACETIPNIDEARALARLAAGTTCWFSFSCRDGKHLRDGTPIAAAAKAVAPVAAAIGVNCTAPEHVESLLNEIRSVTDLPLVAYPNSGETYKNGVWSGEKAFPPKWGEARIIGGCCRITPADIRTLATH
jgi:homocysteine S-methyltransferase